MKLEIIVIEETALQSIVSDLFTGFVAIVIMLTAYFLDNGAMEVVGGFMFIFWVIGRISAVFIKNPRKSVDEAIVYLEEKARNKVRMNGE